MPRRLFKPQQLEMIYSASVKILGEMGMKVDNRECLEALEKFGAKIDYSNERATFSPEVLGRMLKMVKADRNGDDFDLFDRPAVAKEISIGGGGTCPFILNDGDWTPRIASEADCIEACKVVDTSPVILSGVPVNNSECSPKFAPIHGIQIAIETFHNTVCGGTDLFFPEQIPFAVELGRLYKNDPTAFLPEGNCPTSPLEIGKLIADLAISKAPYKKCYAVPTMPIAGANAPITPSGVAVIGVAEILGSYVLAKALNPETPVMACALSAKLDMKTGNVVYIHPDVFVADIAMAEVMRYCLGLTCTTFGIYIDAKTPGMRAIHERMARTAGLGLYGNMTTFEGTLDQGKVFSATQLTIDCDTHSFFADYTKEPVVDEDMLAVEEIIDIGWDSSKYMMHEHTMRYMRSGWETGMYMQNPSDEKKCLERAREIWKSRLAHYEPPNHSDEFLRELRKICEKAKRELV